LVKTVGCADDVECQREGPPCPCLLKVPAQTLVNAGFNIGWAPTIDGTLLTAHPFNALQAGTVKAVPIIIGSCLDEGTAVLGGNATAADFKQWLKGFALPKTRLQEAFNLYFGPGNKPIIDSIHQGHTAAYWAMRRAAADRGMACVAKRVQKEWPAYAWQYVWESRYPGENTDLFGPGFSHQSDQRFLFEEQIPSSWQPAAQAVHQAFAEFIHGRHPISAWPQESSGVIFQQTGAVPSELRQAQCNFWDALDRGSV